MFWRKTPAISKSLDSVSELISSLRLQIAERDATIRELDRKLKDSESRELEAQKLSEELYLEVKQIQFNHGASLRKIEVLNAKIQHQSTDDDEIALTETEDDELLNELNRTLCRDNPKCEMCGEKMIRCATYAGGFVIEEHDECIEQHCERYRQMIPVKKSASG